MTLASLLSALPPDTIQRASDGDRTSLEQMVRAMQRPFYNLALRMLSDRYAAEDATQECLLRVITHLSQYRHEAKFSTWATRVAVNAIFDFKSGLAATSRFTGDAFVTQLAASLDDRAPERPEDALLLKEAKSLCTRALLQCLDGAHRVAFVLGEILEFEAEDAAEILGIQPAAFRKRLSRARGDLTAVLGRVCSVHTAGRSCACHRQLGFAVEAGLVDASKLQVRIADLVTLRTRLTVLDEAGRTQAMYQHDETPDLREELLASLRASIFQMATQ